MNALTYAINNHLNLQLKLQNAITFAECWQTAPEADGQTDAGFRSDQSESGLTAEMALGVDDVVVLAAIDEPIACRLDLPAAAHHALSIVP